MKKYQTTNWNQNTFRAGFTLLEMLTVVMIVGILMAVSLPQYNRAVKKSRATEALAMLRVIYDSGERLAAEFGYKDFVHFSAHDSSNATFARMDMFDSATIKCAIEGTTMTCDHYSYSLNPGQNYISATSLKDGTEFRFYRTDIPRITCQSEVSGLCDLYNLDGEE